MFGVIEHDFDDHGHQLVEQHADAAGERFPDELFDALARVGVGLLALGALPRL